MKLAFSGQGRYPDYLKGYGLYTKRSKTGRYFDLKTYKRVIRAYCSLLADRLCKYGIVDLPLDMGSICAAILQRRPQYRGNTFIGFGKKDWKVGHLDGTMHAFGLVFLPRMNRNKNLRCFGFVANRRLFKKMKAMYDGYDCPWYPIEYNDEMI